MRFIIYPLLATGLLLLVSSSAHAQCALANGTIFVNNTNDEGPGSLREAIHCANSTPGPNTIRFNIASLQDQIFLVGETSGLPLPDLTDDGTVIDGATQAGFGLGGDFTPRVILDGSAVDWELPVNGLTILADDFELYGLEIRHFPYNGIDIRNGDNGRIGDPQRMNIIYANGEEQDEYPMAVVTSPYNGSGILIRSSSTNVIVENNIIGSDENLTPGLGNEWAGIRSLFNSFNNFFGANEDGRRNTIIGNPTGVLIVGSGDQQVSGNLFLCNDTAAIRLEQNSNGNKPAPVITEALTTEIGGTAQNGSRIEVYISDDSGCPGAVCQGSIYLGETTVSGGNWQLLPPFAGGITLSGGESVTALAIDQSQLSSNTSEFAVCRTVLNLTDCANAQGEIFVTNTNDEGPGSLRYAIDCANFTPGPNTILFDLPGTALQPVFVGSTTNEPLPALTDPATIIDGSTQAGGRPVLDGSMTDWDIPYNALFVQADSCGIFGLEIRHFPDDAIDITNASHVRIGRPGAGNLIHSNGSEQDEFPGLPGAGPWEGSGIVLKGVTSGCVIQGNTLGLDAAGQAAGNEFCGIRLRDEATDHLIGGAEPGEGNTIAHQPNGILLESDAQRCDLQQNSLFCNTEAGILLMSGANQNMPAPQINTAIGQTFSGTLPVAAQRVEVFALPPDCPKGPCQGKVFLGAAIPKGTDWELSGLSHPVPPGEISITATATNGDGSTSEFAACIAYTRDCQGFVAPDLLPVPDSCNQSVGAINIDTTGGGNPSLAYLFEIRPTGGNPPLPAAEQLQAGAYRLIFADSIGCTDTLVVDLPNNGERPTADFAFLREGLEVSFENQSLSADTARWTFGDGNGSDALSPQHTFDSSGIYEVCLEAGGPCGNDTLCRLVFVLSSDRLPAFKMDTLFGEPGDTLEVPVYVDNFTDLLGFQYSLQLSDTLQACFLGVDSFNLPNLTGGAFIVHPETITVSWADFSLNAVSVPDSTPIFIVRIVLKENFNGCLPLAFSDTPTLAEVVMLFEGEDVKAPFRLQNGAVCRFGRVSGGIFRTDDAPVGLVTILCNGEPVDTTGADGLYSCDLTDRTAPITLTPRKTTNAKNGVSTFDLLRIQLHILNVEPFDDPYFMIAANADNNTSVSTLDLLDIQQVILNLITEFPNNTSWRFVAAEHVFPTLQSPLDSAFPEEIILPSPSVDTMDVHFVGIKIGDVMLDNDPAEAVGHAPFALELRLAGYDPESGHLTVEWWGEPEGRWSALQGTFRFEADQLELIRAEGPCTFNTKQADEGRLPFLWWDTEVKAGGQKLEREVLARLTFRSQTSLNALPALFGLQSSPTDAFAITGGRQRRALTLNTGSLLTTGLQQIPAEAWTSFSPNPFVEGLFAELKLERPSPIQLLITDTQGRRVYATERSGTAGLNRIELEGDIFPASGLYTIQVIAGSKVRVEKVMKK